MATTLESGVGGVAVMDRPPADSPDDSPSTTSSAEAPEIPELAAYPLVMTTQQVAEVLQINDQVVRRRLNTGQWPGFRAGARDWRMRRLTVRAIILGQLGDSKPGNADPSPGEAGQPPSG